MQKPPFVLLMLLMLFLGQYTLASAEEKSNNGVNDTGVFTLGEVVVSADREVTHAKVDRLEEETLRRYNLDDLTEALGMVPGVSVSRTGARNERTVYVRGFDVKHVPLLLDGVPAYVMYDGYSDYGRFTTFDISQIEVSKGAASVLYGPNTMGGAINVITKRPERPFAANAGIGIASGDTTTAYANLGTNQGKWYLQGGASYVDRDHFSLSDDFEPTATEDGGKRDNSYVTDQKVNFKFGWQPRLEDEYAISYSKQTAEKGNPVYTGDDPSQRIRYWQWPQWDKESIYFNSNTAVGAKSYVKTRLYYDKYKNSLFGYDDDTYTTQYRPFSFRSWYNDDSYGGSVEMGTMLLNRNNLKAALHYKRDQHKEQDAGEPWQTFQDEYYSVGLEDIITLTDRWSLLAAASYDWQIALEAEDYNSDTGSISSFPTRSTSAFAPQVGIFFDFSNTSNAYVTIAHKSRFPSLKDRYSYRFGNTWPNPDLAPEIATNYEIGYKTLTKKISFQSAVFFSDVKDYIQFATIPAPDDPATTLQQNQNIGRVYLYGAEADLTMHFSESLTAGLNYTYLQWDNRSNPYKITGIAAHKIIAYAHGTLWNILNMTLDAAYYADRYSSSNGVRETDSYTIVNFKAAYALFAGAQLEAGINNIFDANYEVEEGFPEEGVNYFANLTYRY